MVQRIENWRADAGAEKNIFVGFAVSAKYTFHRSDVVLSITVSAIFFVGLLSSHFGLHFMEGPKVVSKFWSAMASAGFAFSSTMLGFVIAVYSLFATLLPTDVLRTLAKFRNDKRSISEFKYINYSFLNIFVYYTIYMGFCWIASAGFAEGGPLYFAMTMDGSSPDWANGFMISLISVFVGASLLSLFLIKTLVWNMYSARVLTILIDEQKKDDENKG